MIFTQISNYHYLIDVDIYVRILTINTDVYCGNAGSVCYV